MLEFQLFQKRKRKSNYLQTRKLFCTIVCNLVKDAGVSEYQYQLPAQQKNI